MSPFHQHITSLWILHFSVYSEMEIACHVREYSDGCSPFMLECKFLTKRWLNKTSYLFPKSAFWEYMSNETQHMYSRYLPFLKLLSSSTSFIPAPVRHFILFDVAGYGEYSVMMLGKSRRGGVRNVRNVPLHFCILYTQGSTMPSFTRRAVLPPLSCRWYPASR